jgi:hypothetical protein
MVKPWIKHEGYVTLKLLALPKKAAQKISLGRLLSFAYTFIQIQTFIKGGS